MGLKVLVIGSGAREHAIAHTLIKGESVEEVTVAPGNAGMVEDGIRTTLLSPFNHAALIAFVKHNAYDWVLVGPEVPLIEGIVDDFQAAGIPVFGPTKAAAQIEGSKDFAKQLMERHGVPTAVWRTFDSLEPARQYVLDHGAPIVIKADGLAAGKGVTVAEDIDTALKALEAIFVAQLFGNAGSKVVIEDYLVGQEFSLMCFVNDRQVWPMPIAQDHKRAFDNDEGPNTGGMGAYSPVPQIGQDVVEQAIDTIIMPTVEAMSIEGVAFTGVLYAGLIATHDGPKVIEFNARFGDPETEVVLPRLTSDLGAAITAILGHESPEFTWREDGVSLGVVLASKGYPGNVIKGAPVPRLKLDENTHVFYAAVANAPGTSPDGTDLVATGGRVMLVSTSADTIEDARKTIYDILDSSDTTGLFYRHDIGVKALAHAEPELL